LLKNTFEPKNELHNVSHKGILFTFTFKNCGIVVFEVSFKEGVLRCFCIHEDIFLFINYIIIYAICVIYDLTEFYILKK